MVGFDGPQRLVALLAHAAEVHSIAPWCGRQTPAEFPRVDGLARCPEAEEITRIIYIYATDSEFVI